MAQFGQFRLGAEVLDGIGGRLARLSVVDAEVAVAEQPPRDLSEGQKHIALQGQESVGDPGGFVQATSIRRLGPDGLQIRLAIEQAIRRGSQRGTWWASGMTARKSP